MTGLELAGAIAGLVVAVLAVAAVIGVLWARIRTSSDETTAALWKGEAEAWKSKAERLDRALLALEKRVDHLESENKMLRALHDNREEMNALRDAITQGFSTVSNLLIVHQVKGD
ncbi:hypothetical protein AB0B57_22355 [Micromonospora sp. NPDC049101]|uniref:hypothetical protein n=1 Tax=Micromonospora sp. NPDC049101 TaxID=3155032 RepID=UPI0033D10125